MLKELPLVGEFVEALVDGIWEDTNDKYRTKGDIYQIVGASSVSESVYFIGDGDSRIYIDDAAFDEYRLADKEVELVEENKTKISLIGSDVTAWNYEEDASEFSFKFRLIGGAETTLKAIDELQSKIIKMLK